MILHHVSIGVADVGRAGAFYDAVLGTLGIRRYWEIMPHAIAYGEDGYEFWVQQPYDRGTPSPGNGSHVAFNAPSKEAVHAFHEAALAEGGSDEGAPGPRPDYGADYYGAFVRDPFGNKIEAVLHPESAARMRAKKAKKTKKAAKKAAKKVAKKAAKKTPAKKRSVRTLIGRARKAAKKIAKARTR